MDEHARQEVEQNVLEKLQTLKELEFLYSDTENPLFVWQAITILNHLRFLPVIGVKVPDLPPPEWILSYLARAAIELTNLALCDSESTKGFVEDCVPQILGFKVKGGTNRFVEYRAKRRAAGTNNDTSELRAAGKTTVQANEVIGRRYGHNEASVIRKQRTKGKKIQVQVISGLNETITE